MKHEYRIEKDNLVLRPIEAEDIEQIRVWRNQDDIRKSFLYQGIISSEDQKKWYEKYLSYTDDIMFVIELNHRAVGAAALYHIDQEKKQAEFGRLMIGDLSARGHNLGVRVTKLLSEFGLTNLALEKIVLEVFEDNTYAKSAYEKAGFKAISTRTQEGRTVVVMQLGKEKNNE